MQVHADPLVERIMRSMPQESGHLATDSFQRRSDALAAEQGLSALAIDRIVREAAHAAREEERVCAERAVRRARVEGFEDGFRAGVDSAVEYLRPRLRREVDAAAKDTQHLRAALSEVRPGPTIGKAKVQTLFAGLERLRRYLAAADEVLDGGADEAESRELADFFMDEVRRG